MKAILLTVVLPATVVHVTALILMMAALDRRGIKTNFLLARIYVFKYVSRYKEVTRKETGRTGVLYDLWSWSILVALLGALAAVFTRWI
jgi:hypothetical protein